MIAVGNKECVHTSRIQIDGSGWGGGPIPGIVEDESFRRLGSRICL